MAMNRHPVARNRLPLCPRKPTFSWPSLTSGFDPGCVKTRTPRAIEQQLNRDGRVDESLLRRRPAPRLILSFRAPEICFHTAWTHSGSRDSPIRDTQYRRLQPFRHLHDCSGCFRLERSPGGPCTHWKAPPYHGAHCQRRSKNRPDGGAKVYRLGWVRSLSPKSMGGTRARCGVLAR